MGSIPTRPTFPVLRGRTAPCPQRTRRSASCLPRRLHGGAGRCRLVLVVELAEGVDEAFEDVGGFGGVAECPSYERFGADVGEWFDAVGEVGGA